MRFAGGGAVSWSKRDRDRAKSEKKQGDPMTIWQTALLDPPWEERGSGKIKRGAQKHYPLLKTQDMPGVIRGSGLWTPDENAHVYCWVTNNFLPDGLWLLNELGARYITNIAWTKKRPGIGRYFRGKHELLLFATIGRGWAVRTAPNDIESALDTNEKDGDSYFPDGDSIEAEHEMVNGKRKHSAKPKVFYDMIESRSLGPYVEFFARSLRPGWVSWGNDEAVVAAVAAAIPQLSSPPEPDPQPKKTRARRPEKSDKNGAQRSGESAESDAGHRGNEPETVSVATPESAEIGEVPKCEHAFMGKPRVCAKCGAHRPDVMPIAEMDGRDIELNAAREAHQHDHTCPCPACERERRVPRAFEVKVLDEPLPRMEGPGVVAMLEETFAKTEAALLDGLTEAREEAMRRLQDPPEVPLAPPGGYGLHTGQIHAPMSPAGTPQGPPGSIFHLDGDFAVDPLPGGPTTHLAGRPPVDCDDLTTAIATSRMAIGASAQLVPPDPVPPPRPPSCPHGELRAACVLCRSRR